MFTINYSHGRKAEYHTFGRCIEVLTEEYPELEYGHAGDLSEDGERTLCWECEADSVNDDGANAIASIYHNG